MAYLIAVFVLLALLVGFVVLTRYEAQRGVRFFAPERDALDKNVERLGFIVAHVDLLSFARDELSRALNQLGHLIAHFSLQAVRAVERLLTRLVRHLRARNQETVAPRETAREFVKTLSDFKGTLKATHPESDAFEVE